MTTHALMHDILQRFNMFECPICDLLKSTSDRRLNQLLYEHVTDPDFVTNFLNGDGFCKHHANEMMKKGDPLAHAILYSHLLDKKQPLFAVNKIKQKKNSLPSRTCYMCSHESRNEKNYVEAFVKSYSNNAFKDAYTLNGILCLTHFDLVKSHPKMIQSFEYSQFVHTTQEKFNTLYGVLSEIKRKSDYRYKDESWTTREKKAWKQVVYLTSDQYDYLRKKTIMK
jgi:hypothetical protein